MLDSMTQSQFDEWCAKDMIEPIGTPHGLAGVITRLAMMTASINGNETTERDFMPWLPINRLQDIGELTREESARAITAALQFASGVNT